MSKLKIIEATYYDPKNIAGGINVTKDLIQMFDFENDNLIYDGSYNYIFSDPAYTHKKILKIILEYKNQRYTKIYQEDDPINLPDDLKMKTIDNLEVKKNEEQSKGFKEIFKDSIIFAPNYHGVGFDFKKFISKITQESLLLRKIILSFIMLLLIVISSYWWFSPVTKFLKETQNKFFVDYNDPSKILDTSVFEIIDEMNKLSTDNEKQKFIENYSGLRTSREYGYIDIISTSTKSVVLVAINSLICSFEKKWEQKLLVLQEKGIYFYGVIDNYNIEKKKVVLLYCGIWY